MQLKKSQFEKFTDLYESDKVGLRQINVLPIIFIAIIILSIVSVNLFRMQVVNGDEYLVTSTYNYKANNILRAPRGIIFDKNGEKIVSNKLVYTIFVDSGEFDESKVDDLSRVIDISSEEILSAVAKSTFPGEKIILLDNIEHEKFIDMSTTLDRIPGIYANLNVSREYYDDVIYSNIIGYLGSPGESDIKENIDQFSKIGKSGLEMLFDEQLRGTDGKVVSENTPDGENKYIQYNAISGNNLVLNIDSNWQELGYQVLADKIESTRGIGGAFTIMDIDSGEVLMAVSYPSYDINLFTDGISTTEYNELLNNPGSPLLERNTGVAIPTGSIFKLLTATVGLQEGVVDDQTTFYSDGCMKIGDNQEMCESFFRKLGQVDIYNAISKSSNIYFCNLSILLENQAGGINTFRKYTDEFGIGRTTGIDLPFESAGTMASPELKYRISREPWYVGDMCNTAIGQGYVSATPMQMLVTTAAIANGGEVIKPIIIREIVDNDGNILKSYEREVVQNLSVDQKNLDIVNDAMRRAVTDQSGTLRKLNQLPYNVRGKTGTATSPVTINGVLYDDPHAWVTGIFDYQGRELAFVVNIDHGGWGEEALDVVKNFLEGL